MKTLLVDDHALFRDGLALLIARRFPHLQLLQAASLGQARDAMAAHPDVALVLLDLNLSDSDGLDSLTRLRELAPQLAIVVLSADETLHTILAAIEAGAAGFIPKTAQAGVMCDALQVVFDGGVYLPSAISGAASLEPREPRPAWAVPLPSVDLGLSPRQIEVLRLLVDGKPNKQICRDLQLSESTVKTHLAAIFRKLEVSTRTQAVVAAARLGLRLGKRAMPGTELQ